MKCFRVEVGDMRYYATMLLGNTNSIKLIEGLTSAFKWTDEGFSDIRGKIQDSSKSSDWGWFCISE